MLPQSEERLIEALKQQRASRDAQELLGALITLCSRLAACCPGSDIAEIACSMRNTAVKMYAAGHYRSERLVRDLLEEAIAQLEHARLQCRNLPSLPITVSSTKELPLWFSGENKTK